MHALMFIIIAGLQSTQINFVQGREIYNDLIQSNNDCFYNIGKYISGNCEAYLLNQEEIKQKIVALQLTNCYRQQANMIQLNCPFLNEINPKPTKQEVKNCVKLLGQDGSGHLLQLYVSQMDRVSDICYFLQLQNMQKKQLILQNNLTNTGLELLSRMSQIDDISQKQLNKLSKTHQIMQALLQDNQKYNELNTDQIRKIAINLKELLHISNSSIGSLADTIAHIDLTNRNQLNQLQQILSVLVDINQYSSMSEQNTKQIVEGQNTIQGIMENQLRVQQGIYSDISEINNSTKEINNRSQQNLIYAQQLNDALQKLLSDVLIQTQSVKQQQSQLLGQMSATNTFLSKMQKKQTTITTILNVLNIHLIFHGFEMYLILLVLTITLNRLFNVSRIALIEKYLQVGFILELVCSYIVKQIGCFVFYRIIVAIVGSKQQSKALNDGNHELLMPNIYCQYLKKVNFIYTRDECTINTLSEMKNVYQYDFVVGQWLVQFLIRCMITFLAIEALFNIDVIESIKSFQVVHSKRLTDFTLINTKFFD